MQHLRHDAGAGRSDGDRRLFAEGHDRAEAREGRPADKFHIEVFHPLTGERVKEFGEVHDRLFHLFIVSRDMKQFAHIHPTLEKDGSLTVEQTLPEPGQYVLFSDFMPVGGGPQLITTPITTAGFDGDIASSWPNLKADSTFTQDGRRREGRHANRAVEARCG